MKQLQRDLARFTPRQWMTLIGLLIFLNLVVLGGLVWIIAADVSPDTVPLRQKVLAQALSTRTPYPTFTPRPTATPFPTATPQPSATNTRVPTWTPTITPTPPPTDTPTVTPTAPPTNTPPPPPRSAAPPPTATPAPTPTPNVDYTVSVRQLTPCENQGKHHIFIHVQDAAGNGIPGVDVKISWSGGEAIATTGTKADDPGLTDFAMFKGTYFVEVLGALSEIAGPITPNIPKDELCPENDNPVANSLYHYSFEVIFTKVR